MTGANERSEPDFAAFIGIDWADQRHAWELQTTTEGTMKRGNLDHTPEAVDDWATELGRRFGGRPIAIACLYHSEVGRATLIYSTTTTDLETKLIEFQHYYNGHRTHAGLEGRLPEPPIQGPRKPIEL